MGRLTHTMDPSDVADVLEWLREQALERFKFELIGNAWQTFNDPHGAPYQKLVGEFPQLRPNLTSLIAGMLERARAELTRIVPLEESGMLAKAHADTAAMGIKPKDFPQPGKSPLVEAWESFIGQLDDTHAALVGGRPQDRVDDQPGQWWYKNKRTLDGIVSYLPEAGQPVNRFAPKDGAKRARLGPRARGRRLSTRTIKPANFSNVCQRQSVKR